MTTLSGTVAAGEPLRDAQVLVWSQGVAVIGGTDANGRYSIAVPGSPPFMVTAGYGFGPRALYSMATRGGTVNVTPFTHLLTTRLLGKQSESGIVSAATSARIASLTDAQIAAARQDVVAYLLTRPSRSDGSVTSPVDASAVPEFITAPFQAAPGDPYDNALERLGDTMMEGETFQGVAEHMLFANDATPSPTSIFFLDFQADCTITAPLAGAALPSGRVAVKLTPLGLATVGPYVRGFVTGDLISVTTASLDFPERWTLQSGDDQIELDMDPLGQKLAKLKVIVSNARGASECTPVGDVPMATHLLSRIAWARLLTSHLSQLPGLGFFSCPGSQPFPGVRDGTNQFLFDRNGAMHVNDHTDGYALHLPSMTLTINFNVVSAAGGLGFGLRGFHAESRVPDGYDIVDIRTVNFGVITSARFDRKRGAQTFTKLCPPT